MAILLSYLFGDVENQIDITDLIEYIMGHQPRVFITLTVNTSREIHGVLGRKSVRFMLNGVNLRDALVLD